LTKRDKTSFIARFLKHRGPSLHHITFKVSNIYQALNKAEHLGYRVIGYNEVDVNWKEFFLYPKESQGIVVQIAEAHGSGGADAYKFPVVQLERKNKSTKPQTHIHTHKQAHAHTHTNTQQTHTHTHTVTHTKMPIIGISPLSVELVHIRMQSNSVEDAKKLWVQLLGGHCQCDSKTSNNNTVISKLTNLNKKNQDIPPKTQTLTFRFSKSPMQIKVDFNKTCKNGAKWLEVRSTASLNISPLPHPKFGTIFKQIGVSSTQTQHQIQKNNLQSKTSDINNNNNNNNNNTNVIKLMHAKNKSKL